MLKFIPCEVIIYSAKTEEQKEFSHNLPEYLPGISRIVKTDVSAEKYTLRPEGKRLFADLSLKISILYASDYNGALKNAVFHENMSVLFPESYDVGDDCETSLSVCITSCYSKPVSSRKTETSVKVALSVTAFTKTSKQLFTKEDDDIFTLSEKVEFCEKNTLKECLFDHEAHVTLDDTHEPLGEITYVSAKFSKTDARCLDKKLEYKLELDIFSICENPDPDGDDKMSYSTLSFPVNIEGSISDDRITEEHMPFIYPELILIEPSVSFDNYGENKETAFNIKYALSGFFYCKNETDIIIDAFCEKTPSDVKMNDFTIDCISETIEKTESLTESVRCDGADIREITECFTRIMSVSFEYSGGGLYALARCKVSIFGLGSSGELLCADCPVNLHIPLTKTDFSVKELIPDVIISIGVCKTSIKEGNFVCDFEVNVSGVLTSKKNITAVDSITPGEKTPLNDECEIIICFPSKDESLWSVSKKYLANPDLVKKANSIENTDVSGRHFLIIP